MNYFNSAAALLILVLIPIAGFGDDQIKFGANLITNGDFSTHDFSGWIVTPADHGSGLSVTPFTHPSPLALNSTTLSVNKFLRYDFPSSYLMDEVQ